MNLNPIIIAIPLFFLLMGIELWVERSQNLKLYRLNDATTSISCGITDQVLGVFTKVVLTLMYMFVYEHFRIFTIPVSVFSYIALFFLYDLCFYWSHRWRHTVNLFWATHVVHHSSEDYNLSTALRQSWFEEFTTFYLFWALAFLGFQTEQMLLVGALNLLYQFWIHTQTIGKMGILEYVLNTPSHHRVHHGRNPQYIDKNYAGMFIIWDRLFGTFEEEKEEVIYGVTALPYSFNPLWVHAQHFLAIGRQLWETEGIVNKFKTLFYHPAWSPQGAHEANPIDKKSHQKFDLWTGNRLQSYIGLQYALVLVAAVLFLIYEKNLDLGWKIAAAALICAATFNLGELFLLKKSYFYLEILRVLSVCVALIGWDGGQHLSLLIGTGAYGLFSLWGLAIIRDLFRGKAQD